MNLDQLKKTYFSLSTGELIQLTKNLDDLIPEAIELLKSELEKRGGETGLKNIEEHFNKKEEIDHFQSNVDIDEHVRERVKSGEALESIKHDLRSKGIELSDRVQADFEKANDFLQKYPSHYESFGPVKSKKMQSELTEYQREIVENKALQKRKWGEVIFYISLAISIVKLSLVGGSFLGFRINSDTKLVLIIIFFVVLVIGLLRRKIIRTISNGFQPADSKEK